MSPIKLITSLLCLSTIFCSDQCPRKHLRDRAVSSSTKRSCLDRSSKRLHVTSLPLDIISSITSYLNQKHHDAFSNLSSRDLNHSFIIHALETSKHFFLRAQSLQIVRSGELIRKIKKMYGNVSIYPITLTFSQADVPLLKQLDVFSFIRRVQTVVIEGAERMVIEAGNLDTADVRTTQWDIRMYDPKFWVWSQPPSLRGILQSETVTAVKTLRLHPEIAHLFVGLSWSVTAGDINWTFTKTSRLHTVKRGGISVKDVLLNRKLRYIQSLTLIDFDSSVLVNDSVLANLENLESLILPSTHAVDLSALAKLTKLKSLDLSGAEFLSVSTLPELKSLESLNLTKTFVVDVSALVKLANLKSLYLVDARFVNMSTLPELKSLESLNLSGTKVVDVSVLAKLANLKSLNLSYTNVVHVSALAQLKNMESLNLSWTNVVDVSTFTSLTNLKYLDLSGAKFLNFSTLPNLENLESVKLSRTKVVDVSALAQLTHLKSLDLSDAKLLDVSTLPELTSLKSLNLRGTNVVDVSSLPELKNLTSLILLGKEIDVCALKNKLPKLEVFDFKKM
jgi:hypothetical protein